jgi:hypothetical protein
MTPPCRLLSRHPHEADLNDCLAHRCEKHAAMDAVVDGANTGPDQSECALCVASMAVHAVVVDVLTPIVLAYGKATGALVLNGSTKSASISALCLLLDALTEKVDEDDFEIGLHAHIPEGKVN